MAKEMLINTVEGQECRIAILDQGRLEQLYAERASSASHVGNIYKARVTNVESSIQAAFVDFGMARNGFLHISDIHPQYFPNGKDKSEPVGKKTSHRNRPPIQNCLRRGQEIVVQMIKEGIGTKGPTMTTYLSIPGRLLVMMPSMSRLGVSRKIEDETTRQRARDILNELNVPSDIGFIVRTAGADRSKRDLQRDMNYLLRLGKSINARIKQAKAPAAIYQESDLVIRTIRDVYNNDITRVICDNKAVAFRAKDFLNVAVPRTKGVVELYTGKQGLFHDYGLENQLEQIYSHRVEMPSGGSLVIDQTEALVAIDVNSGRFRKHTNAETTAFKMNLEAADEIARQLRLRDLGGLVVIDFIDMREENNRRAVTNRLKEAVKPDKAKTRLLKISSLGILEMTRQRIGPSLKSNAFRTCECCDGTGLIKSEESQALAIIRSLERACANDDVAHIEARVTLSTAHYLANFERNRIASIEADTGKTVIIRADPALHGDEADISCTNTRGSKVAWEQSLDSKINPKIETIPIEQVTADAGNEAATATRTSQANGAIVADPAADPKQAEELASADQVKKKSKRRGRRGGRKHKAAAKTTSDQASDEQGKETSSDQSTGEETSAEKLPKPPQADKSVQTDQAADSKQTQDQLPADQVKKKSKRRGRRGGRKHKAAKKTDTDTTTDQSSDKQDNPKPDSSTPSDKADNPASDNKQPQTQASQTQQQPSLADGQVDKPKVVKSKRRRRRSPRTPKKPETETKASPESETPPKTETEK